MSNKPYKSLKINIFILFLFFLINFVFTENAQKDEKNLPILYPSVLSLQNKGLIVVQQDGIHFYDSDKKEETSKIIKFEIPIKSEEENEKISIAQFPEKEGGHILVFVLGKLYIMKSNGVLFKKEELSEINSYEGIKIIPYIEQNNNIFYIISYKKNAKHYGFNYFKFDLLEKKNSMIISKDLESLKNPANSITSKNEIFGKSCLFMKNKDNKEETFTCFLGVGFPAEIQVRAFSIKSGFFEEKNNYRYLIGQYEIENFKLISAIPNEEKNSCIIYYYKNNILSQIKFDFTNGLYSSNIMKNHIDLNDEFWEEEANRLSENKETIFSSRLYFTYCKSYLIFLNENFSLENKGFISHDNKCANLLSYYNFFRDNKYSMSVETLNNKVLVKKKRNLQTSSVDIQVPEKCQQDSSGYSEDSLTFNLCIKCNNAKDYYRVYDPDCTIYCNGQNFVQCFNETTKKNFYLDKSEDTTTDKTDKSKWLYMPCYETCEKCDEGGDAYNHKCKECALRYKFFNDSDNSLCEAECSYAYYYTIPLRYYECTETNSCPEGSTYLVPEIRKCVPNCKDEPNYGWTYAGKCYSSCDAINTDVKDVTEQTCKDKVGGEGTSNPRCAVSYESFNSDSFITAEGIKSNAQTYAKDFADSSTHINYYNNSNAILVIYKDETCVTERDLQVPSIDLNDECEDKIYQNLSSKYPGFNEKTDMIVALVGGSTTTSGIKSFYSFFYKDGTYINVTEICEDATVEVTKQIDLEEVDDEAEKIASQGINIFDLDSPFYQDVCFMYDSPNGKDATPQDRINTYFPNISICEEGCTPSKVNLTSFEAICKCEFNDIMSSTGGVGEKILEDSLGDLFEMIDASNIVIFKCAKDVFVAKHFFKNVGSYIALGIMIIQAACVLVYYLLSYNPMIRYLYYLSEYQCSVIDMKNNKKGDKEGKIKDNILNTKLQKPKEPPKKEENPGLNTPAVDKLIDEDEKKPKKLDLNNNNNQNVINSNNNLVQKKNEKNEKDNLKKDNKNEKKPLYADKLKDEYDVEMDEYLKTDIDDMEFEDALKYDERGFCEYFYDRFKEKQIIMDTFFNPESLKPMTIKIIILFLNIILYFVINGLFYSEEYVSDLFNSDEEEKFFSFFPRSISRFLYTTLVGAVVGIVVDFVTFDEKKVKRLFLREKKNTLQIKYEVGLMTTDIKRNYLILIIICFVIDLVSLYYVNCFNNVYPNLTGEWIKSSICIIIIFQILYILIALLDALIRLLAFKLKSERVYKIKDLLD